MTLDHTTSNIQLTLFFADRQIPKSSGIGWDQCTPQSLQHVLLAKAGLTVED